MKLIYIANIRIPTEKAHGLQITKSCEAFADHGLSVKLIVPKKANKIKDDVFSYYGIRPNFKVEVISSLNLSGGGKFLGKYFFYIQTVVFAIMAIRSVSQEDKKDATFYSRDFIILFFLCLFGVKNIAEIHDYRLKRASIVIRSILNKSSKIIVNSGGTKLKLLEHYDVPNDKLFVIANGVEISKFDIRESKNESRIKMGIDLDKQIIAYVGRIETAGVDKGVGFLLKAFQNIAGEFPRSMLYIVGGPDELASIYREGIMNNQYRDRIIFTGHVDYRDIPFYLRAIDIVVIPLPKGKHAETTSPVKLFEFMAAAKAVIVPSFPSIRECVDEKSVFFYQPDNLSDLTEKIKIALGNPLLTADKEKNIRETAEHFTWSKRAEKIIKFL